MRRASARKLIYNRSIHPSASQLHLSIISKMAFLIWRCSAPRIEPAGAYLPLTFRKYVFVCSAEQLTRTSQHAFTVREGERVCAHSDGQVRNFMPLRHSSASG